MREVVFYLSSEKKYLRVLVSHPCTYRRTSYTRSCASVRRIPWPCARWRRHAAPGAQRQTTSTCGRYVCETVLLGAQERAAIACVASLTQGLDPATIEPWAIEANNCRCLPRRCPPQPVSLPVESCHVDDKELRGAELRGADAVLICVCSPSIVTLNFTERHGEWCSCC